MKHWDNFYKNFQESDPSNFAKYVLSLNLINENDKIIEIGCGNGRDLKHLRKHFSNATGLDAAEIRDLDYINQDVCEFIKNPCGYDVLYSRFFFHSIPAELTEKIIKWNKNFIFAEFRVKEDVPILFTDHERFLVDPEWFKNLLISENYQVLSFEISKGWSKYKNEDPLLARVIAKRI